MTQGSIPHPGFWHGAGALSRVRGAQRVPHGLQPHPGFQHGSGAPSGVKGAPCAQSQLIPVLSCPCRALGSGSSGAGLREPQTHRAGTKLCGNNAAFSKPSQTFQRPPRTPRTLTLPVTSWPRRPLELEDTAAAPLGYGERSRPPTGPTAEGKENQRIHSLGIISSSSAAPCACSRDGDTRDEATGTAHP